MNARARRTGLILITAAVLPQVVADSVSAGEAYIREYKPDEEIQQRLGDCTLQVRGKGERQYVVVEGLEEIFKEYPRPRVIREILWFRAKRDRSNAAGVSLYMLQHVYRKELSWHELSSVVAPYLLVEDDVVRLEFAHLFLVAPTGTVGRDAGGDRFESFLRGLKDSPFDGFADPDYLRQGEEILGQRFRDAPLAVIGFGYEESPELCLRTMLGFSGPEDGASFSEIRLGEHAVTGALLKKRFGPGPSFGLKADPQAKAVLTNFAKHPSWWVRLYAAEIMRQNEEYQDGDLISQLKKDPHPLVSRAISRIIKNQPESQ